MERFEKHFSPTATDPEILPFVGQHADWLFLTHDARQRYVAEERDAIMASGVAHFIHVGHLTHSDLAESFLLAAPRILRFRDKHLPPFIAKVHRPERKTPYRIIAGAITLVLTREQWKAGR